jgi:hypothetical protein
VIDAEAKSKIFQANISNIIRKVKSGKPLSSAELELLEQTSEQSEAKKPAEPLARTIVATELCKLTGLTDRRHRQLAHDGYFPPPIRGKYQFEATIRGNFKYYQERSDGEMGNKVKFEAHRKLKLINDRTSGTLMETKTVSAELQGICAEQIKILRQKLENEYPTAVAGMDPAQARIFGKRLVDDICAKMRDFADAYEKKLKTS